MTNKRFALTSPNRSWSDMSTLLCSSRVNISPLLKKIVSCPYRANPAFVFYRKSRSSLRLIRARQMAQKIKREKSWTTAKAENAETSKLNASCKVLETLTNSRSLKEKFSRPIMRRQTSNALSRLTIHTPNSQYTFSWRYSTFRGKLHSIGKKNNYNLRMCWSLGPTLKLEVLKGRIIITTSTKLRNNKSSKWKAKKSKE